MKFIAAAILALLVTSTAAADAPKTNCIHLGKTTICTKN